MSICYVYHCSRKKDSLLDWVFGYQEHKQFLAQIADECGIGAPWKTYADAAEKISETTNQEIRAFKARDDQPIRKRGRKTKQPIFSAEDSKAVKQAKASEQQALDAVRQVKTELPMVDFLLMDPKHPLQDETCCLIRLPLRQIVEQWQPAEKGWIGWRDQGLEICEAMDLACEYPPGGLWLEW
jgi:hypothetical protein